MWITFIKLLIFKVPWDSKKKDPESCVTAIFRTAAKYHKLMFLMKLHYSIFKVL